MHEDNIEPLQNPHSVLSDELESSSDAPVIINFCGRKEHKQTHEHHAVDIIAPAS
jgi:hypothetical protein